MKIKRSTKILLLISVLSLLVVGGLLLSRSSAVQAVLPKPTAVVGGENQEMLHLQSVLQNDSLSPEVRGSVEEKLAMAERMAVEQAQGQVTHGPKVLTPLPTQPAALITTVHPIEEGIFEGSAGLIRPSMLNVVNGWQGLWNGSVIQVFAGASPLNSNQGIFLWVAMNQDGSGRKMKMLNAPDQSGALRIKSVENGFVSLDSEGGDPLVFDLNTQSFQTHP